jgi:hypothetical protein
MERLTKSICTTNMRAVRYYFNDHGLKLLLTSSLASQRCHSSLEEGPIQLERAEEESG